MEHTWVAINIEPIEIITTADGDVTIVASPDEEGSTQYGCNTCGESFDLVWGYECLGIPNGDDV